MLQWFSKELRKLQEVKRDERGFTLIELLVVVIIIGILAAIAIPIFLNQRTSAQDNAARTNLRNAATAQQAYYTDEGTYTTTTADLQNYGYPTGTTPAVAVVSADSDSYCMESQSESGTWFRISTTSNAPEQGQCTAPAA